MSEGRLAVGRHDDALARGEAVVLDDVRGAERVERGGDLLLRRAQVRHGRRHTGRGHHLLGEGLGALQTGRLRRRPEDGDAGGAHRVGDPRHQRGLGPHDDEVGPEPAGERRDGVGVGRVDGLDGGDERDAGVARGRDDAVHPRVVEQGADEGVLTGTGADDEDLHGHRG